MTRTRLRSAGAVTVLLLVTACGSTSPHESAPALAGELTEVDTAIADRRYDQAADQLNELARATVTARDSGELSEEQAERILASVATLTSTLPRPPLPSTTPSPDRVTPAPDEKKRTDQNNQIERGGKGEDGHHDEEEEDDDD